MALSFLYSLGIISITAQSSSKSPKNSGAWGRTTPRVTTDISGRECTPAMQPCAAILEYIFNIEVLL